VWSLFAGIRMTIFVEQMNTEQGLMLKIEGRSNIELV
jgi:hypothetical protein